MLTRTLYRLLMAFGAVAVAATPVLVYSAGGRAAGDYADAAYLAPVFYAAGALAFWKQPDHRCARWLVAVGSLIPLSHAFALVPAAVGTGDPPLWIPNLLSRVAFALAFAAWAPCTPSSPTAATADAMSASSSGRQRRRRSCCLRQRSSRRRART